VRRGTGPRRFDEQAIAERLYAPDLPDVDLFIRTSNEQRISNFLLWQIAYAELWFTEVLWPDFDRHVLFRALHDFQRRQRRFGAVDGDATAGMLGRTDVQS
jgi:undecaprenyl diphosphate synthase